jgi:hypothetical protein
LIEAIAQSKRFPELHSDFSTQLEAISRIELWLSGYDIYPGEDQFKKVRRRGVKNQSVRTVSLTEITIKRFWRDNKVEAKKVSNKTVVCQELFHLFQDNLTVEEGLEESIEAEAAFDEKLKDFISNPTQERALTSQLAKLSSIIWDGAKRLVKNLFRWLRGKIVKTKQMIANVARYLSSKARKSFDFVKKVMFVLDEAVSFSTQKLTAASKSSVVAFSHQRDFDQFTLIDSGAPFPLVKAQFDQRSDASKLYSAATRIFKHLILIAKDIASMFVPSFGWLRALIALYKLAKRVKGIGRELKVLEEYSEKYSTFSSQFAV